jgi:hypothetical protein
MDCLRLASLRAISETATPHRMGAALTYARRARLIVKTLLAGRFDLLQTVCESMPSRPGEFHPEPLTEFRT